MSKKDFRAYIGKVDHEVVILGMSWEKHYPLHYFANNGNVEKIRDFLKKGYDINEVEFPSYEQRTALHYACESNSYDVVKEFLCDPKIDVMKKDFYGKTADMLCTSQCVLDLFVKYNKYGKEKFCVKFSQKENVWEQKWQFLPWCEKWPLHYFAMTGEVNRLIEYANSKSYVDVNEVEFGSYDLRTPLFYCCEKNNYSAVEWFLMQDEIDVNAKDFMGKTADEYAGDKKIKNLFSLFKTLPRGEFLRKISNGKKKSEKKIFSTWKKQIFLYSAIGDLFGLNKFLQENPYFNINEVEFPSYSLWTALHYGVVNNNVEIVKELLCHPQIDINVKDFHFKTAFEYAATTEMKNLIKDFKFYKNENYTHDGFVKKFNKNDDFERILDGALQVDELNFTTVISQRSTTKKEKKKKKLTNEYMKKLRKAAMKYISSGSEKDYKKFIVLFSKHRHDLYDLTFMKNNAFYDTIIITSDYKKVYVNYFIVALFYKYFSIILKGGKVEKIFLKNFNFSTLLLLMKYIYLNEIIVTYNNVNQYFYILKELLKCESESNNKNLKTIVDHYVSFLQKYGFSGRFVNQFEKYAFLYHPNEIYCNTKLHSKYWLNFLKMSMGEMVKVMSKERFCRKIEVSYFKKKYIDEVEKMKAENEKLRKQVQGLLREKMQRKREKKE